MIDESTSSCESIRERLVEMAYGELDESVAGDMVADHLSRCADCRAFSEDLSTLRRTARSYRTQVLSGVVASQEHRAATQRDLVALVRAEVRAAHRSDSVLSRLERWVEGFIAGWRHLQSTSVSFRLASQGAVALGVGILLAVIVDVGREASMATVPAENRLPVTPSEPAREIAAPDAGAGSDPSSVMETDLDVRRRAGELPRQLDPLPLRDERKDRQRTDRGKK